MNWIAYITIFVAGMGVGLSFGVFFMATLQIARKSDDDWNNALSDAGYLGEAAPVTTSPTVTHDFTGRWVGRLP